MSPQRPLQGKRIAVTRARQQAPPLLKLLRDLGAIPISYPCLAIKAPVDPRPLDNCLLKLGDYDWLVLTSSNAPLAIVKRLEMLQLAPDWSGLKVAVVGPKTRAEWQRLAAIDVDFMPVEYGTGQLAPSLPLQAPCRILLPQSNLAHRETAETLRARGATVTTVTAYQTVSGEGGEDLPAMIEAEQIDALTFASPSALHFFRQRWPSPVALQLPTACIGPATAQAARDLGFQRVILPSTPGLQGMARALAHYFSASASRL